MNAVGDCLFCKIAASQIPAKVVHADEELVAFEDISPQAPMHLLIIPVKHVSGVGHLAEAHDALMGRAMRLAAKLAADRGFGESGYRIIVNSGPDAGQSVPHLHLHVMAGRPFGWPAG